MKKFLPIVVLLSGLMFVSESQAGCRRNCRSAPIRALFSNQPVKKIIYRVSHPFKGNCLNQCK